MSMKIRQLHPWNVSAKEAVEIQRELRDRVTLCDTPGPVHLVAGIDVGIPAGTNTGNAVVAILSFPQLQIVEVQRASCTLEFPYIPGLLSFREAPVILDALEKVNNTPDLIVEDGQGIAHPRGLGIAAHIGVILDMPAIGCAKSHLFGKYAEPGPERGDSTPLLGRSGEQVGSVLRTRTGIKPVFISPGNRIGFESSVRWALALAPKYRLPEPIRAAHRLAAEGA
jgi:deoxyribonuclease V